MTNSKVSNSLLSTMIKFTIPGRVQPQERPRHNKWGSTYDPPKSREYKKHVVKHTPKLDKLFEYGVKLEVDVYIEPNKASRTKPKLLKQLLGISRPLIKPDLDNLVKGIKDGMKGLVWIDDSQVIEMTVRKFYSLEPRAEVRVTEVIETRPEFAEKIYNWVLIYQIHDDILKLPVGKTTKIKAYEYSQKFCSERDLKYIGLEMVE